jgi:hypothetical protein
MVGRWAKKSRILREYNDKIKLSRGCEMCGYDKEAIHLQWHHVDPNTKYKAVAVIISEDRNLDTLNKEIEKCICVCKACHGKLEMEK